MHEVSLIGGEGGGLQSPIVPLPIFPPPPVNVLSFTTGDHIEIFQSEGKLISASGLIIFMTGGFRGILTLSTAIQ